MEESLPELADITAKLHPLERAVLPSLQKCRELSTIIRETGLKEIEVMRALQWLENKKVLKIISEKRKVVNLDRNGLLYRKSGLPEKAFLAVLDDEFKGLNVLTKKSRLGREEVNACLGLLRRRLAIEIRPDKVLQVRLTERGRKMLHEPSLEDNFLAKDFPLPLDGIKDVDRLAFDELKKRKEILKVDEEKTVTVQLTGLGEKIVLQDLSQEIVNRLTSAMLKSGAWRDKQLRAYDIEINVPRISGGRKHFVNEALEYARGIWLEMGFREMSGDFVQTSFWNFDALFTAQDHPVRELQDTFYLGGAAEKGKLPDAAVVKKIKEVHEKGGATGSKGWQYAWNEEEAKKNVLRTHTTVLSARTLAQLKEKGRPAKLFALGKCFRNEALDWSHLFEFNQTEGIVIDEKANFRHLLGYLKAFFGKMGFPQARFRPAYFPYTEPSVEIDVYHPVHQKWVELGGAGIFRPEVVIPLLGQDIPVLAWGPGFDRTILDYYQLTDIRDLYRNDVKQLREMRAWLK